MYMYLTIDCAGFHRFDRWLYCISAIRHWMHVHFALWLGRLCTDLEMIGTVVSFHACHSAAFWSHGI